jgi:hypothetical protein
MCDAIWVWNKQSSHVHLGCDTRIPHREVANKNCATCFAMTECKVPRCSEAYIKDLDNNIIWHCLIERLHEVHASNWTHKEEQRRVCRIDNNGKEYMKHAEKVCRKTKCCWIPYSPEASIWIRCS